MWCCKRKPMLGAGEQAPAVELPGVDGEPWSLYEELKQRPVLLVFVKISCPTCQFTLPFLQRMETSRAKIMLVSQDDSEGIRQLQQHLRVSLPAVLDEPRIFPVSNAFRISHVPSIFFVETDGTVQFAAEGFDKKTLEQVGQTIGVVPFRPGESVPALRPG